ncbi:hypothetical protein D3C76_429480 [compost metagenome]
MAFKLHQHFFIAAPAAQGPRQCSQQQVVDLGVVSRRGQLQQLPGLLHVQADGQGLSVAMQIAALRMVARQFATHTAQLALPPGQFVTQRIAAGVAGQARGPVADGVGLGRQRLATVQRLQVFQQHPPGHAINHQVMNRQQQPLSALPVTHQQGAQQRPLLQVQAALHVSVECLTIIEIGDSGAPQQLLGARLHVLSLPAALGVAEAQAQAVMVLHQRSQCLFKGGLNQGLAHLQQHSLVPVLRLWHVTVEEPVLDRRQPGLALAQALLDGARGFAELNHSCQGLDGLMLEQVAWGELQAGLPGAADHLNRQDRVAPQLEEVVLHADPGNVEHIAPDLRQLRFHLVARRLVLLACLFQVRQRQRTAVELAVAHQRQAVEQHQVRRHHVVGQVLAGIGFHRFAQQLLHVVTGGGLPAHQIAHQLLAARQVQRQHDGLVDILVRLQAALDFAQFDAEAADLHLLISTADILHQAIGTQAYQVAGTVQAPAFGTERVGDKALGSEAWPVVVTLGQAGAADVQFANAALRQQGQILVEDVGRTATDDAADRYAAKVCWQGLWGQARQRHDHGFGRAVGIEALLRRKGLANTLQVLAGQRLAPGNHQAYRQLFAPPAQVLRQLAAVAGGKAQNAHLLLAHQLADVLGAPLPLGAQYHARTTQQRHPQALAGSVEVDGIEVQLAVIAAHAECSDHRLAVHGELAMADHHALGFAGGA